MPKMPRENCLCDGSRSTQVPEVPPADVDNCGNHLSGYPKATAQRPTWAVWKRVSTDEKRKTRRLWPSRQRKTAEELGGFDCGE